MRLDYRHKVGNHFWGVTSTLPSPRFLHFFSEKTIIHENSFLRLFPDYFHCSRPFTFTGIEWCKSQWLAQRGLVRGFSETGYSYFGARYYDSDLSGLFLSVDPMADKYPSLSPYAYCAWNPVKLVDPDGNEAMENDDEWKYNMTSGLLSHVSDKGGKDQQTVHCVSNIGNQEVLNEIVSFNGQIEDMFDFSVINASWDQIIDGTIRALGGLVTTVGGVAVGVSTLGLAIPVGAGIAGYGGYQLGTGLETIAEGIWGGTSGNKYERQEMIKSICSWATDCGLAGIIAGNTDVSLKNVSKAGSIATGIATLGVETVWSATQITKTLFPAQKSQLPEGATVTRPSSNSRPHVGVGLMPY